MWVILAIQISIFGDKMKVYHVAGYKTEQQCEANLYEFKKLLKKNTQSATCIYVPQKEPA